MKLVFDENIYLFRFTRELQQLKKMADYSSRDTGSLNEFLGGIGPEYTIYTYSMLNAGVDRESIRGLSDEQLENECRIVNSIHRLQILNAIKGKMAINHFNIQFPALCKRRNIFMIVVIS